MPGEVGASSLPDFCLNYFKFQGILQDLLRFSVTFREILNILFPPIVRSSP